VLRPFPFTPRNRSAAGCFLPGLIGPIARAAVISAALWAAAGCRFSPPPEFRLNLEGRDPQKITLAQRDAITETLEDLFGTPDAPKIPDGVELDPKLLEMAAGPMGKAADPSAGPASDRGLYRRHCAGCHGISGDGAGPLASILDPYPRDFRNGVFKFTSTLPGAKPSRDDLERTLRRGVTATAMPSFAALDPLHRAALVEYVKYLSIRGETERYVIQLVVDENAYLPLGVDAMELIMEDGVLAAAESWALPEEHRGEYVIVPPPEPPIDTLQRRADSIARGRKLFTGKDARCVSCHGPQGAGDGEQNELYDDWNKPKKGVTPEETERLARLYTLPIQQIHARNFREEAFRGGSRPVDVYWRIYAGIKGTPMPAGGPMPGVLGPLTPEEIWHVVHYVQSLGKEDEG
jgi:mono/diheme cytochrome c family protein